MCVKLPAPKCLVDIPLLITILLDNKHIGKIVYEYEFICTIQDVELGTIFTRLRSKKNIKKSIGMFMLDVKALSAMLCVNE